MVASIKVLMQGSGPYGFRAVSIAHMSKEDLPKRRGVPGSRAQPPWTPLPEMLKDP